MINRLNFSYLKKLYQDYGINGVILSGIVGSGKTSLIESLCEDFSKSGYEILRYEGDDAQFRMEVREASRLILNDIQSAGLSKPFIYVDEIQKEPAVFDAIKLAHDKVRAAFIVSGSNPAFLQTTANDRLQRRAITVPQFPFSLSEIMQHEQLIENIESDFFANLFFRKKSINEYQLKQHKFNPRMPGIVSRYLRIGGLPQAWLAPNDLAAMNAVRLVAERGITETYQTTIAVDDEVRRFLADRNSQEFSYKGIQQSLRSNRRSHIDQVIDHLMNHGYLFKKTPFLGKYATTHKTYFANYSWVDPGLVSYYAGIDPTDAELGFRLESAVHTRLIDYLARLPVKGTIYYFKPFSIKPSNNALAFEDGEIDFVVQVGKELTPIEVKLTHTSRNIDTSYLEKFINAHKLPFGIVLYGGAPHIDEERKIIFFPYWLI